MNKFLAAAVLGLSLIAPAHAWDKADMRATIAHTNVLVNDGCSGTLLGDGKYVLTAHHCIMEQYATVTRETIAEDGTVKKEQVRIAVPGTVTQVFFKGPTEIQRDSYVFKIVQDSSRYDLALLRLQSQPNSPGGAVLSCSSPDVGDTVFAVGNSFGVLYSTVTKGIVSSKQRSYRDLKIAGQLGDLVDNGEHGLVQHSAPIAPGNSGGALYDDNGQFVGVNVRGAPGGFSFSVPLSDIKEFLNDNEGKVLLPECHG